MKSQLKVHYFPYLIYLLYPENKFLLYYAVIMPGMIYAALYGLLAAYLSLKTTKATKLVLKNCIKQAKLDWYQVVYGTLNFLYIYDGI